MCLYVFIGLKSFAPHFQRLQCSACWKLGNGVQFSPIFPPWSQPGSEFNCKLKGFYRHVLHGYIVMFKATGGKPNQRLHVSMSFMGLRGWGGVGGCGLITFICTTSHTWWYATVSLLALPHIHDATLLYVFLHCLTYMMLRYCKSSCTSSHTWCYATVRLLALPHIHDATLL